MDLETKIKKFYDLKALIEQLTDEKDKLAQNIKEDLEKEVDHKFETEDGYNAKLTEKTNFTYLDEGAIFNYIISKGLSDVYISKKIDTVKLNKELKTEGYLYEAIKPYLTKTVSNSLSVTKK